MISITTKSPYALAALVELAGAGEDPVPIGELARRRDVPAPPAGPPDTLSVLLRPCVQRGSCGSCACCLERLENLCPKITKTYAGSGKDKGGFANLIRFPTAWVFKAPEGMASELLGPLMCAGITTYSPLKRHGKPGAKVSEFDGF